jgi:hypothetical protein
VDIDDPVQDDLFGNGISLVEVDGPDNCFKSIAIDRFAFGPGAAFGEHQCFEAQPPAQAIEFAPADNPGTHFSKEAFIAGWESFVEVIGDDRAQDGIAQVLQPFVVQVVIIEIAGRGSFMAQGKFKEIQVFRVEAKKILNGFLKFPVF